MGRRAYVEVFELRGQRHAVIAIDEPPPPEGALTAAELAVLALVRKGLSNAEIAAARGRSVRTVANQVASLLRKLEMSSRTEVAVRA